MLYKQSTPTSTSTAHQLLQAQHTMLLPFRDSLFMGEGEKEIKHRMSNCEERGKKREKKSK